MTTDTTPTHSTAAFCNKCGFLGVPQSGGYHLRPRDGEPCNYEASIARIDALTNDQGNG